MTEPGLTKLKGELFDLGKILKLLDRAGRSVFYRSEEKLIVLVTRLIRIQHQWIEELKARVEFLERDGLQADRDHTNRRQELATLQAHHADLQRRYDLIMERRNG